ncbi:hypothetical protein L227DRAFT_565164 [Lentinus tigrinus ALCF2SS1-6]|uniref:Uncharacterized protein n=1 Tax=Lentinus tigrinus ALCF2SS1-6 TaxID=1328759 RepID=A0A5C2S8K3_9APHY|nr:hypothetical protein L227DRAFT_565164 [Lentinus tigrinus ALCF2SS1-6]
MIRTSQHLHALQSTAWQDEEGTTGNMDPTDVKEWVEAKRRFREAASRVLSKQTLKLEQGSKAEAVLPADNVLYAEHAHAGVALLIATLRLLHDRGSSFTLPKPLMWCLKAEHLPIEDFHALGSDVVSAYSLALQINEKRLNLQADAVGVMLFYLREECRSIQAKQYAWIANPSGAGRSS